MPLTFAVTALLAHLRRRAAAGRSRMLVGAVLAPTDPVFASAIVGRPEVPARLRSLLNVESGLNDGLALPVVLVLLAVLVGGRGVGRVGWLGELGLGVALGVVVPAAAVLLLRSRYTSSTPLYASLGGLSIGLIVLGLASATHANLFLAAFTAGITVATLAPEVEETFAEFGELVTELLKLAAILVFGTLISPAFLAEIPVGGYAFALLALRRWPGRVRSWSLLLRSSLPLPERAVAAWFGPEGLRLGRVRAAHPRGRRVRRRRDVPPHRPGHRRLDPRALLDRRAHRAGLQPGRGPPRRRAGRRGLRPRPGASPAGGQV